MDAKKRTHSDVDPGSSPEVFTRSGPKRSYILNMADDESRAILEGIQSQLSELLTMKSTLDSVQSSVTDLNSSVRGVLERFKSIEDKCKSVTQAVETCTQRRRNMFWSGGGTGVRGHLTY